MGKAESAFSRSMQMEDTTIGWRFINPQMKALYGVIPCRRRRKTSPMSLPFRVPIRTRLPAQSDAHRRGAGGRTVC
jgi:hypothetical protein